MHPRSLVAALAAGLSLPAQEEAQAIHWEPDLTTAHAKSAETGKPVIAYFTFDT